MCREIPGPHRVCAERYQAPVTQSATLLLSVASPLLFIALVAPQPISVNLTVIIARFARRALWKSALSTEDSDTSR